MAISHICLSCGTDLARVRAALDPRYGLPLIQCPCCHAASVRRRHPILRRWRAMRQAALAFAVMIIQFGAFIFCAVTVTIVCVAVGREINRGRLLPDDDPALYPLLLIPPLMLGTWLTAGLHHWRRWTAWLVIPLIIAIILSLNSLGPLAISALEHQYDARIEIIPFDGHLWFSRLAALAGAMLIAVAGIPLGMLARHIDSAASRYTWRAVRRRRRFARLCQ